MNAQLVAVLKAGFSQHGLAGERADDVALADLAKRLSEFSAQHLALNRLSVNGALNDVPLWRIEREGLNLEVKIGQLIAPIEAVFRRDPRGPTVKIKVHEMGGSDLASFLDQGACNVPVSRGAVDQASVDWIKSLNTDPPVYRAQSKADLFSDLERIVYVPENGQAAYSAKDLLALCEEAKLIGDAQENAWRLYELCEWQSPETVLQEDLDSRPEDRVFTHPATKIKPQRSPSFGM